MKMKIVGTGSSLAEKIMSNNDLSEIVDTSDEWIKERTGISSRHISTGETVVSLAAKACKEALESAKKSPDQVDIIILATCSPEVNIPSASCQVQDLIGANNAVAFDINAACGGFLFALNTVYSYLKSGIYKNALIVGSEVLSKIVDWNDRGTCILFGDGAGAVYVEADNEARDNYVFIQKSNGSKGNVLTGPRRQIVNPCYNEDSSDNYIKMDGREIYRFATKTIPEIIKEALAKAELSTEDVTYFMLHQANLRIIMSIANNLSIDMEKVPVNVDKVGNMSSASIPVLLDECNKKGMLKEGQTVVLSGFGAGLTYGASIITI